MRFILLFVLLAPAVVAQEAIRVDVNLINIAFSVRDASGRLVPSLTKEDFNVAEDGVPQTITFFARNADVPLTLALVVDFSGSQREPTAPFWSASGTRFAW